MEIYLTLCQLSFILCQMAIKQKPTTQYSYLRKMYKMPATKVNSIGNDTELIHLLKNDFTSNFAKNFIEYSTLSLDAWARLLPVSKRTLQRQLGRNNQKLDLEISEAMVEIGEIFQVGLRAFDDRKERLVQWLETENPYLSGKMPLELMDSHKGRDLVKDELLRIEYGAFA